MLESVFPMFSSSFTVSGLMFRSLILFEFICVYGVRKCSSFILLQVVSQHHLLKRLSLIYCILLPPFESVLMRWMKLEPIIQSEESLKEKHKYSN